MLSWDVSWWAVVAAAVLYMLIGAAWYSPGMFGKRWAKLSGRKNADMSGGNQGMAIMVVAALVQAFLLANLVRDVGATTMSDGLLLGLILWAGFVGATSLGDVLFGGRSWKLWQLNNAYYLIVLLLNGWLLAVWK
ncbi:DUF1761 domain-containing protein [Candidatus Saccharibacteria bacterium]|nr:DUF1761 domain-containing protein [Candidatus Saccharibacteria bacterium]